MAVLANLYRQNEESLTTKHFLNENRMIKSSHPLFEGGTAEVAFDCFCVPLANANIHGHSQPVQLYATSAAISGTKFGLETHIASPINVVTQISHYLSK